MRYRDTSFWFGLQERRDPRHGLARAVVAGGIGRVVTANDVDQAVEDDSWRWLRARDERAYSFAAATSFAVMRRRRIREALAFDGEFNAAGFVEVRAG
jgi:uncharacterized protein